MMIVDSSSDVASSDDSSSDVASSEIVVVM